MIEFLWRNKEWLFSGIGVAILILCYRIIHSIFSKVKDADRIQHTKNQNQGIVPTLKTSSTKEIQSEQLALNYMAERSKKKKKKRRREKISQQPLSDLQSKPFTPLASNPQPEPLPPPKWRPAQIPSFQLPDTSFTPQSLTKMITDTPLLKQRQVASVYKGIIVSWEGQLTSANPSTGQYVKMFMTCGELGHQVAVGFDVNPQHNVSLALLKQGDKVMVTGQIEDIQPTFVLLQQASVIKLS